MSNPFLQHALSDNNGIFSKKASEEALLSTPPVDRPEQD